MRSAAGTLVCVALVCGGLNTVAQPMATESARWNERLSEMGPTSSPQQVTKYFDDPHSDRAKYVLFDDPSFQLKGWTNGVVRWRYNDSGRNASVVGASTAAEAVATLQAAQAKWTAACNVQFIYEGTTTAVPTPLNMSGGNLDNISTVGWAVLSGSTTGVAGISYSGSSQPLPIVEGDIAYNNAFSHNLSVTALHETGHVLGIDHSDVSNVVMSGPPLTNYVSLNALKPDDIAACVALYGGPVATTHTISGTVRNGGAPLQSVGFCAQPATGLAPCIASDAAGFYSCAVPNGWVGTLHSPSVSGLRIPQQIFSAVSTNLTRDVAAAAGVPSCNLDVDNNGLFEPGIDGVVVLRRLAGFTSLAVGNVSPGNCAGGANATTMFNAANASNYNVTGGTAAQATTTRDGLLLLRAMRALTGTAVTNGITSTSWASLRSTINSACGSAFLP